ncbi:MAG: hypothetical protein GX270_10975 [Clostridiaceae bacterium]|nr:hypothetical protein [Clostridiaceae bacterium]
MINTHYTNNYFTLYDSNKAVDANQKARLASFYYASLERSERGKNGGARCPGAFIFSLESALILNNFFVKVQLTIEQVHSIERTVRRALENVGEEENVFLKAKYRSPL